MTRPADLVAAPLEYFGLKLYPLKISDWGSLDRWMQQDIMDQAIDTMRRKNLTGEELEAWTVGAQKLSAKTSTSTELGMIKLNSFDGFIKILELSSQGQLTAEKKAELENNDLQDIIETAANMVLQISQSAEPDIPETPGKKGKKGKKKKKG